MTCYSSLHVYIAVYDRMSRDGSSLSTLLHKAGKSDSMLLVLQDGNGVIFGGLITEKLKTEGASASSSGGDGSKYYGNGTVAGAER
jgi:TLD